MSSSAGMKRCDQCGTNHLFTFECWHAKWPYEEECLVCGWWFGRKDFNHGNHGSIEMEWKQGYGVCRITYRDGKSTNVTLWDPPSAETIQQWTNRIEEDPNVDKDQTYLTVFDPTRKRKKLKMIIGSIA